MRGTKFVIVGWVEQRVSEACPIGHNPTRMLGCAPLNPTYEEVS
jgi:hypothetical protein